MVSKRKILLSRIERYVLNELKPRLRMDLRSLRIVKEADIETCAYYHLRRYLKRDPRWTILARFFARRTGHYIDRCHSYCVGVHRWREGRPCPRCYADSLRRRQPSYSRWRAGRSVPPRRRPPPVPRSRWTARIRSARCRETSSGCPTRCASCRPCVPPATAPATLTRGRAT